MGGERANMKRWRASAALAALVCVALLGYIYLNHRSGKNLPGILPVVALAIAPLFTVVILVQRNLHRNVWSILGKSSLWWAIITVILVPFLMILLLDYHQQHSFKWRRSDALSPLLVSAILFVTVIWASLRTYSEGQEKKRQRRNDLLQEFEFCMPTEDLTPVDLGYVVLEPGAESKDKDLRPFYKGYVSRRFAWFSDEGENATSDFDEDTLAEHLRQGKHLALHGLRTMGKTRTLYDIVKKLEGWWVVKLRTDRALPSPAAIDEFIRGKSVVVLLDNLDRYANTTIQWERLRGGSGIGAAASWAIAAACRDGSELDRVRNPERADSGFRDTYAGIELKLALLPLTEQENDELARLSGQSWDRSKPADYVTPGDIVMQRDYTYMSNQFNQALKPWEQDLLRSIHLLTYGGIQPLTLKRVVAVWNSIYTRTSRHIRDSLASLGTQSFIARPSYQDPVVPIHAYLKKEIVLPCDRRTLDQLLGELVNVFVVGKDAEALFMLGNQYFEKATNNFEQAILAYDAALEILKDNPVILTNKGMALLRLGESEKALSIFNGVLVSNAYADAHKGKGYALHEQGEHGEAVSAFDDALGLQPGNPDALHGKGLALLAQRKYGGAVSAFEQALSLRPGHPGTLFHRAKARYKSGRGKRLALAAVNDFLAVRPRHLEAVIMQVNLLTSLESHGDALAACEAGLQAHPTDGDLTAKKLSLLEKLGRDDDANELRNALAQGGSTPTASSLRAESDAEKQYEVSDALIPATGMITVVKDPARLFMVGIPYSPLPDADQSAASRVAYERVQPSSPEPKLSAAKANHK